MEQTLFRTGPRGAHHMPKHHQVRTPQLQVQVKTPSVEPQERRAAYAFASFGTPCKTKYNLALIASVTTLKRTLPRFPIIAMLAGACLQNDILLSACAAFPFPRAPIGVAPAGTAPHRTTPRPTAPRRTAPYHTVPHRTTPHRTAPRRAAPCHTAPRRAAPCRTAPHRTASHSTALHHTTPNCNTNRNTTHCTTPHAKFAPRCHVKLHYTTSNAT